MLDTLDLGIKLPRKEAHQALDRLGLELSLLQRAAYENGIPVFLVFEGWDGAGKGDAIGRLVDSMDPRGFRVHAVREPTAEERLHPLLWRFWRLVPARGAVSILDRSCYSDLIAARLAKRPVRPAGDGAGPAGHRLDWERALDGVQEFERQLVDDGTLLVKFFLHVSHKEQKRRVKAWAADPYQRWRAEDHDARKGHGYKKTLAVTEEILALTSTTKAPWVLVEAEDDGHRRVKVLDTVAAALRRALTERGIPVPTPENPQAADPDPGEGASAPHPDPLTEPVAVPRDSPLAGLDLSLHLSRDRYKKELDAAQDRLRELEFACYAERRAAVIVFEGSDAGGKGGAIKRLTARLDPRGYAVIPVAAPHGEAAAHHYLWRFWREVPKGGHIAVFDRSWYGRVLVERVEGFAEEPAWRRAYQEINEFERALADGGTTLVKFWIQVSPEEQLRRFRERERTPRKRHKITDEDWRNRAKLPRYVEAVSEMIRRTSTPYAPWTLVEGDDKLHARIKVLTTVVQALERALKV